LCFFRNLLLLELEGIFDILAPIRVLRGQKSLPFQVSSLALVDKKSPGKSGAFHFPYLYSEKITQSD
jgi:hypothetical protein